MLCACALAQYCRGCPSPRQLSGARGCWTEDSCPVLDCPPGLQRDERRSLDPLTAHVARVVMASLTVSSTARNIEKHRKSLSLLFYRAVRDLKPVWMLEDMRTMETFYLEEDERQRSYSPSEALLYAIVHDHQAYAQYLLSRFTEEALAKPGERFCCCPSSAPHLSLAVRYDRRCILGHILQRTHKTSHTDHAGSWHTEGGRTALHLACELLRPEAVMMMLGSGASPHARDQSGLTPLDVVLEKLRDSKEAKSRDSRQCLDHLLMFMHTVQFQLRGCLKSEPELWRTLLGEDTYRYLSGRSPAPLLLSAMRTVVKQLRPDTFPDCLHELPLPPALLARLL
ncbi:ankyrin repeat domain-containing protein 9 [Solea solea]|uniref:ankyrin repeat domain-containing protein 9 n=1 Tax=Solea solea TaxID=90069 RepID=UPI00272B424C|nr:ankyrin repeat domain-containing protein 9 [Solea solea]